MKNHNVNLKDIKDFFSNCEINENPVKLDKCTTVLNVKKFIETHTKLLESNSGNELFLPYYERLLKLYLILKKDE